MDALFQRIRESAALVHVLYLAIGAGVVSILQPVHRDDLLDATRWMTSSIPVPRWLFGLCLIVGTSIGLLGLLAAARRNDLSAPAQPWARYRRDVVDQISWTWQWYPRSQRPLVDIHTLVGSCRACQTKLDESRVHDDGVQRIVLRCGTCKEDRHELPLHARIFESYLEEVCREIEARAQRLETDRDSPGTEHSGAA